MSELFAKVKIGDTSKVIEVFNAKVAKAIESKDNVLMVLAIDQEGYENISILISVRPDSTASILDSTFELRTAKNGRKFYGLNTTDGKVTIVEVK